MSLNRIMVCTLGLALVLTAKFSFVKPAAAAMPAAQGHDSKAADEQEVLRLNAECNEAELHANLAVMDRCEADTFKHTHSDGRVENKTEYLKGIGSGDHHFLMLDWTEAHARIYGDSAIVDGQMHLKANNLGKIADFKLAVMTAWVKEQGKWREVAWFAAKMSPNLSEVPQAK